VDGYSASIEIDVDYAGYQNNGTKKIPARPYFFLQDSDVDQLYNRFSGEVNRRILKGWG
jgi:phage gpG-like protein